MACGCTCTSPCSWRYFLPWPLGWWLTLLSSACTLNLCLPHLCCTWHASLAGHFGQIGRAGDLTAVPSYAGRSKLDKLEAERLLHFRHLDRHPLLHNIRISFLTLPWGGCRNCRVGAQCAVSNQASGAHKGGTNRRAPQIPEGQGQLKVSATRVRRAVGIDSLI